MNTSHPLHLPVHPTRRHPLTGQPLRAIGHRKDGRLIWPIMGGDETAGQSGGDGGGQNAGQQGGDTGQGAGQQAGGTEGQGQGQQAAQGQQQAQQDGQQQTAAEKVEDLPDWAQKLIRDTRQEAGNHRTKATQAEQQNQALLGAIGKALGLDIDGQQAPKPEELTNQLTTAQQQARQSAVELAVYRTASKHQGDPDALLDSRTFLDSVKDLDPAADDFAAKVDTAIKAAVEANQKLKAGRAPGASSVDHGAGGPGGTRRTSNGPVSLDSAVSAHYSS